MPAHPAEYLLRALRPLFVLLALTSCVSRQQATQPSPKADGPQRVHPRHKLAGLSAAELTLNGPVKSRIEARGPKWNGMSAAAFVFVNKDPGPFLDEDEPDGSWDSQFEFTRIVGSVGSPSGVELGAALLTKNGTQVHSIHTWDHRGALQIDALVPDLNDHVLVIYSLNDVAPVELELSLELDHTRREHYRLAHLDAQHAWAIGSNAVKNGDIAKAFVTEISARAQPYKRGLEHSRRYLFTIDCRDKTIRAEKLRIHYRALPFGPLEHDDVKVDGALAKSAPLKERMHLYAPLCERKLEPLLKFRDLDLLVAGFQTALEHEEAERTNAAAPPAHPYPLKIGDPILDDAPAHITVRQGAHPFRSFVIEGKAGQGFEYSVRSPFPAYFRVWMDGKFYDSTFGWLASGRNSDGILYLRRDTRLVIGVTSLDPLGGEYAFKTRRLTATELRRHFVENGSRAAAVDLNRIEAESLAGQAMSRRLEFWRLREELRITRIPDEAHAQQEKERLASEFAVRSKEEAAVFRQKLAKLMHELGREKGFELYQDSKLIQDPIPAEDDLTDEVIEALDRQFADEAP